MPLAGSNGRRNNLRDGLRPRQKRRAAATGHGNGPPPHPQRDHRKSNARGPTLADQIRHSRETRPRPACAPADGRVLSGSGNPEKPKSFRDAARVQACVASRTRGRSSVTRTPPGRRAESTVPSAVGAGRCPTCLRGAASRQDRCRYPVCPAVSSVWPGVGKTWIPD